MAFGSLEIASIPRTQDYTVMKQNEDNKGAFQQMTLGQEVDGVSAMAGNITNELMSKVGVKNLTKGVKVEVQDKNVTVDLAVTMEYDYNIPTTCQAVQQKVKNAIEYMTGLTCSDVNIRIAGVNMKKDK